MRWRARKGPSAKPLVQVLNKGFREPRRARPPVHLGAREKDDAGAFEIAGCLNTPHARTCAVLRVWL
jgi:hypothetical protein